MGNLIENGGRYENGDINPEYILDNTRVFVLKDAAVHNSRWLNEARWIVARGYSDLSEKDRDVAQVYQELCQDGYDQGGRSVTLAALTHTPYGKVELSGTHRIVFGQNQEDGGGLPPIDMMGLIEPEGDWPHRLEGIADDEIGEFGRFVIPEKYNSGVMKQYGIPVMIAKHMYEESKKVIQERGIRRMYALVPPYVARFLKQAEVPVRHIPGTNLKSGDIEAEKIYSTYSKYWLGKSPPQLYQFTDFE